MDLMEAMKERHSVRQYTDQTLDEEVIRFEAYDLGLKGKRG